jgi:hypothetical protein
MRTEESLVGDLPQDAYTNLGSLYVLNSLSDMDSFLDNLQSNSNGSGVVDLAHADMLRDMGKELHFGVRGVDGNLLVFRKVQIVAKENDPVAPGNGSTGYVVTQNNYSTTGQSKTAGLCFVARV